LEVDALKANIGKIGYQRLMIPVKQSGVSMSQPDNQKPKIEYPCQWGFKVIGNDEATVRTAIGQCLEECVLEFEGSKAKDRPVQFGDSRSSGGGKYVSLGLTVEVKTEDERNTIFRALADRPEVKMVL
jgi:putative lipoic acid-binding regulatory protein